MASVAELLIDAGSAFAVQPASFLLTRPSYIVRCKQPKVVILSSTNQAKVRGGGKKNNITRRRGPKVVVAFV